MKINFVLCNKIFENLYEIIPSVFTGLTFYFSNIFVDVLSKKQIKS